MQDRGPERLTVVERLGAAIRVPFPIFCLAFACLAGPPLQFLFDLLQTKNLMETFRLVINVPFTNPSTTIPTWEGVLSQSAWFASLFFGAYSIRIMRMKIVSAEPELTELAFARKETVHKAFGRVSSYLPAVILTVLIVPLSLVYILFQGQSALILVYSTFSTLIISLLFANWLWVFLASLWGLHKFGEESLKLKSPLRDRMMGARPLGSMALTLGIVYFVLFLVVFLALVFVLDVLSTIELSLAMIIGVVMFFLPLNSIHKQMAEGKSAYASKIRDDFTRLAESLEKGGTATETMLKSLVNAEILQFSRQEIANASTWPFDTGVVSKLAAIIFSVIAVLISREITLLLHI